MVWHEAAMISDAELLHRYAEEGSDPAFAEVVERHIGLVYGAALRQLGGAEHRAQDVTQSVFVDLARHAAELSRRAEIAGWLYTSTHHAAAKLKRTEQRRAQREQEAHAMNEILGRDEPASVDWARLRPVLDDARPRRTSPRASTRDAPTQTGIPWLAPAPRPHFFCRGRTGANRGKIMFGLEIGGWSGIKLP